MSKYLHENLGSRQRRRHRYDNARTLSSKQSSRREKIQIDLAYYVLTRLTGIFLSDRQKTTE